MDSRRPSRAVFIVGCPRGGTSILYKTLSVHEEVATTTNLTRRFRGRFGLVRLAELVGARHRPVEAGELWKAFWPSGAHESGADDLTASQAERLTTMVDGHLRHFGKRVFLNKRPGLVLRVRWLAAALPEARFVHVVRDGRAVANSVLRECKKADRHWSWLGKGQWPDLGQMDYASFSGALWSRLALLGDRAVDELGPERAMTVRYEEFVSRSQPVMEELAAFCGLSWTAEHAARVPRLEDRNDKWRREMSAEEQTLMLEQARPGLEHFGYL